jgi:hypothetical protein
MKVLYRAAIISSAVSTTTSGTLDVVRCMIDVDESNWRTACSSRFEEHNALEVFDESCDCRQSATSAYIQMVRLDLWPSPRGARQRAIVGASLGGGRNSDANSNGRPFP